MNLAEVVFRFYPYEVLKKHLLEPEQFEKSDYVFQDAVATLLALSGCSTVVLGKKEFAKSGEKKQRLDVIQLPSGHEAGSADIIISMRDKLFVIDCCTHVIDESKIRKLQQTIHKVASEGDLKHSKVGGLIFSPQECEVRKHFFEDVYIKDRTSLTNLLKLVSDGEIEKVSLETV